MVMSQSTSKPSAAGYAYWAPAYFICVATLYLWGYWAMFEVNVLEHIGVTDIIKAAAYPVASTFGFFAPASASAASGA
jgi:hypothetical protein